MTLNLEHIVTAVLFLVIDVAWIWSNSEWYSKHLTRAFNVNRLQMDPVGLVVAYGALVVAQLTLVKGDPVRGALWGGLSYAVWNGTNRALLGDKWSLKMAAMDTAWGATVNALVAWLAPKVTEAIRGKIA